MTSGSSTIPAKRARTEGSGVDEPSVAVHSGQVWYDDGNIVLQAENVQFKVYKGVLIQQSSVFAGMFDLPHVVPGDECLDGCPVIHLPDSAEDLGHALRALYDKSYFRVQEKQHFYIVAGCLRIGTKYDISCLRHDAIQVLKYHYPGTLSAFDGRRKTWISPMGLFSRVGLEFEAANLAEETAVQEILPQVYFECSEMSVEHIMRGVQPRGAGQPVILRPPHQATCLIGRDRLIALLLARLSSCTAHKDGLSVGCTSPEKCSEKRRRIFKEYGLDPYHITDIMHPYSMRSDGMCTTCGEELMRERNEMRKDIWRMLPKIFKIGANASSP